MFVFVSYQRADTLFAAHAVGYALRASGHEPFIDTGSIEGGELFTEVIANAIAQTNVMLAMIGPTFDWARLHAPGNVVTREWQRARFHHVTVVPVLVDDGRIAPDVDLPPALRWFARRNAYALRRESFSADVDLLVAAIPVLAAQPRRSARVLWVDDRPANNEQERRRLRPHGIVFDNVVSTAEALEQLANESYDLVISDLGRAHSSDRSQTAGESFLQDPVVVQGGPPVIVYANEYAVRRRDRLMGLGALEVTANPETLFDTVRRVLGRNQA